jgi:hypothetical protein
MQMIYCRFLPRHVCKPRFTAGRLGLVKQCDGPPGDGRISKPTLSYTSFRYYSENLPIFVIRLNKSCNLSRIPPAGSEIGVPVNIKDLLSIIDVILVIH